MHFKFVMSIFLVAQNISAVEMRNAATTVRFSS